LHPHFCGLFLLESAVSSEWINELVATKKQEMEGKRIRDEKELSDRRLLDAHAGEMWAKVRSALKSFVQAFNEGMSGQCVCFEDGGSQTKCILRVGTHETDIHFHRECWLISSPWGTYRLTVIEANEVVWQVRGETARSVKNYTSEQVAREEASRVFLAS
jgi:hypothetical protein